MTGRGQGAFEYLLILGGTVLVAAVVLLIVQGSTGEVNNTIGEASNDYLSALANRQQAIEDNYTAAYTTPDGCSYSNSPCAVNQTCNPLNNSCYEHAGTLRNGCDYANPNCPVGYYCKYNFCLPGKQASSGASTPMPSPLPTPSPSPSPLPTPSPSPSPLPSPSPSPSPLPSPSPSPTPENGVCGSSNGASAYPAPSSNLCSAGTNSTVTGSGPWSWFCNGSYGGSNASCSASLMARCNTTHTLSNCTSSGGDLMAAQGCVLCRFNTSSCSTGWSQFQNWSTTSAVTSTCTTASHAWSNTSTESCTYNGANFVNGYGYASLCYMYGSNCFGPGSYSAYCYCVYTVSATVSQIGCG